MALRCAGWVDRMAGGQSHPVANPSLHPSGRKWKPWVRSTTRMDRRESSQRSQWLRRLQLEVVDDRRQMRKGTLLRLARTFQCWVPSGRRCCNCIINIPLNTLSNRKSCRLRFIYLFELVSNSVIYLVTDPMQRYLSSIRILVPMSML